MEPDEVEEFARLFRGFLEKMQQPERARESLVERLRRHLGADPTQLPVVGESYPAYDLANVHRALTARFTGPGRTLELLGVSGAHRAQHALSELLTMSAEHNAFGPGAVDLHHVPISVDEEQECVGFGFFLGSDGTDRYATLLRGANPKYGAELVELEVLATSRHAAKRLLGDLPALISELNVYRGQVVSLEGHHAFGPGVGPFRFHQRPGLTQDDIVMPDGVLERIERQVVGIARHRLTLREQGQHLRRGLLLYGPPGTGKTHTVRYLMSRLPEFTVVLLAGTTIHFIAQACALARMLQPALVVLEDCDLVAEARDFHHGMEPLLFQVLNEMDGLADDADVAFLLTTNRADLLEPALSQRPGRVDLAVEIPLPDSAGRRRLIELYGPALQVTDAELAEVAERIEGTTASLSKELVRRASVLAAERGVPAPEAADLSAAADELLSDQDTLTRRLLGGPRPDGETPRPTPGLAPRPGIAPGWSMGSY
jgi:hypothetical protein